MSKSKNKKQFSNEVKYYINMSPYISDTKAYRNQDYFYKLIIYFYIAFELNNDDSFVFSINQIYKDCFSHKSKQRLCALLRTIVPELLTKCRIIGYKFNVEYNCDKNIMEIKNNTKITISKLIPIDDTINYVLIKKKEFYQILTPIKNDAPRQERLFALYSFIKYTINLDFLKSISYENLHNKNKNVYAWSTSITSQQIEDYVHIDKSVVVKYTTALKDRGLLTYFWLGNYENKNKLMRNSPTVYSLKNNYQAILRYSYILQEALNASRFTRQDELFNKIKQMKGNN
jgi:hypothetical protein